MNHGIRIYPNPVTETLFFDTSGLLEVHVLTMDGKLVSKEQVQQQLDVSQLAAGPYLIRIIEGDRVTTTRILKRK